jgi:uncharacterized protein YbjT (DUF2867 family)
MRILVLGADGFIGGFIVAALNARGHEVISGSRRPSEPASIACDFSRDVEPEIWIPRLSGIDVVINAVGILRESRANSFERIHVAGPQALFEGCVLAGVRRVIQISALGSPAVGEYLASKHRGDEKLTKLDLDWTVIRPSLVYSTSGSYGGTSLLRAMAAVPGVIVVPGSGEQQIQPIRAEDLGLLIARLVDTGAAKHQIIAAVGPKRVSLLDYLRIVRRWLGLGPAKVIRVPLPLANCVAWLGEHLNDGPLGTTMWRMLQQGNVGSPEELYGITPLSVDQAFSAMPSAVQDRWHARLYFLSPILRVAIGILWIASGVVGFMTPIARSDELLASAGISIDWIAPLVWTAGAVDFVLGVLALAAWRLEVVAVLMCVSLVIYTVFIAATFPSAWLEPFGGLLKNLPLIPAVLIMGVLSSRR